MLDVDKAQTNTTSPFFPGLGHGDFHWLSATREISIRVPHGLTKGMEHPIPHFEQNRGFFWDTEIRKYSAESLKECLLALKFGTILRGMLVRKCFGAFCDRLTVRDCMHRMHTGGP